MQGEPCPEIVEMLRFPHKVCMIVVILFMKVTQLPLFVADHIVEIFLKALKVVQRQSRADAL